ncbi:MAG: hypothetical protein ACTSQJ_18040 [Promethearchaeota archaeon]
MTKIFQCPRCDSKRIIDLESLIGCLDCHLEFDKEDIRNIKDKSSILAISEKKGFLDAFKEKKDDLEEK